MKVSTSYRARAPEVWLAAGIALICAGALTGIGSLKGIALSMLFTQAGLLCIACAGANWSDEPVKSGLGLDSPVRPLSLKGAIIAVISLLWLSFSLNFFLEFSGMRENSALVELEKQLTHIKKQELVWMLVCLALLPALAEELLFRGLLLGRLKARWGPNVALTLSSLLFGAAHLDLAQGLAATVLGVFLGGLRLRTGSVHASILCHASNNGIAVLLPQLVELG